MITIRNHADGTTSFSSDMDRCMELDAADVGAARREMTSMIADASEPQLIELATSVYRDYLNICYVIEECTSLEDIRDMYVAEEKLALLTDALGEDKMRAVVAACEGNSAIG